MAQSPKSGSLEKLISELEMQAEYIRPDRKEKLDKMAGWIRESIGKGERAELLFVCTHNSRRSQIAEIWTRTVAGHYGLEGVSAWSGGTEATAFDPRMVAAAGRAGFELQQLTDGSNPRFKLTGAEESQLLFSKNYRHDSNPQRGFLAVMVCAEADAACPVVSGAAERISLPFEDPKKHDGTAAADQMYDRCLQDIGRELIYALRLVGQSGSAEQE